MTKGNAAPDLKLSRAKPFQPTPRVVQMTPTMATELLNRNTMNRSLRAGRVEKYAADMKEGRWTMNGATIAFTADGELMDGQHRLFAVIEAGVTVPMLVVEGLDKAAMPTIDTGAARGFRDVLSIGGMKNATLLAATARWLYWYEHGRPAGQRYGTIAPSHAQLSDFLAAQSDLDDRVGEIAGMKQARRIVTPSVLCFAYTMAFRFDAGKAGQWVGLIDSGAGLEAKHPVHQLRERMIANKTATAKLPPEDVAALTVKSWNQFKTGKRTVNLRWSSQEAFPVFVR